jgi:hypothetical protein
LFFFDFFQIIELVVFLTQLCVLCEMPLCTVKLDALSVFFCGHLCHSTCMYRQSQNEEPVRNRPADVQSCHLCNRKTKSVLSSARSATAALSIASTGGVPSLPSAAPAQPDNFSVNDLANVKRAASMLVTNDEIGSGMSAKRASLIHRK